MKMRRSPGIQRSIPNSRVMDQVRFASARVRVARGGVRDLAWSQEPLDLQVSGLPGSGQPIFRAVLSIL